MSTKTESILTTKIIAMIRRRGHWAMKVHGGAYQQAGIPDICAVVHGRSVWIEVKRPGERPTELQELKMKELRKAGAWSKWIDNVDDAERWVKGIEIVECRKVNSEYPRPA